MDIDICWKVYKVNPTAKSLTAYLPHLFLNSRYGFVYKCNFNMLYIYEIKDKNNDNWESEMKRIEGLSLFFLLLSNLELLLEIILGLPLDYEFPSQFKWNLRYSHQTQHQKNNKNWDDSLNESESGYLHSTYIETLLIIYIWNKIKIYLITLLWHDFLCSFFLMCNIREYSYGFITF